MCLKVGSVSFCPVQNVPALLPIELKDDRATKAFNHLTDFLSKKPQGI